MDFPIAQFIAADEPITTRMVSDPRLSWDKTCAQVRVFPVPGDHSTLLSGPGARAVASILRDLSLLQ